MIFVTVGAQLPFDRLVQAVDEWAGRTARADVFAQIARGRRPAHLDWTDFLEPDAYRERVARAQAVIAHAGMGSIITALQYGKPILVLARRGGLGETRNDHQVATATRLRELGRVAVADNETALANQLERIDELSAVSPIPSRASGKIIDVIREFVADAEAGRA